METQVINGELLYYSKLFKSPKNSFVRWLLGYAYPAVSE